MTSAYTIQPFIRTPEQVIASYYDREASCKDKNSLDQPSKPQNKHLWATLDGKDAALSRLAQQIKVRQGSHIQHKVALCDGCSSLQSRIAKQFSDFALILDFIHANEYLWKVANALFSENNEQRFEWMRSRTLRLLSGKPNASSLNSVRLRSNLKPANINALNCSQPPTILNETYLLWITQLTCPKAIPLPRASSKALAVIS